MNNVNKQIGLDWDKVPPNTNSYEYQAHTKIPCFANSKTEDFFPYYWENFCNEFPGFKDFTSIKLMSLVVQFAMSLKYRQYSYNKNVKQKKESSSTETRFTISFQDMMIQLWTHFRMSPPEDNVLCLEDALILEKHIKELIPDSIGKLNTLDALHPWIDRFAYQKKVA